MAVANTAGQIVLDENSFQLLNEWFSLFPIYDICIMLIPLELLSDFIDKFRVA